MNTIGRLTFGKLPHEFANDTGIEFYNAGDFDSAICWFCMGIKLNPKSDELYMNRAAAFYAKGEYANALIDWKIVEEIGCRDSQSVESIACLLVRMGRFDDAIAHIEGGYDVFGMDGYKVRELVKFCRGCKEQSELMSLEDAGIYDYNPVVPRKA